jgi:hypothetical protein
MFRASSCNVENVLVLGCQHAVKRAELALSRTHLSFFPRRNSVRRRTFNRHASLQERTCTSSVPSLRPENAIGQSPGRAGETGVQSIVTCE